MLSRLDEAMLERADVMDFFDDDKREMMRNNHANHFRYMESVFALFDPSSFVETVLWVFRTYRSHGFHVSYWPAMLDTVINVMKDELSETTHAETVPFYEWLIVNIPFFTMLTDAPDDFTGEADHDHVVD